MSYFEQKEWKARLAEFIGRRKLTRVSDGATELYDVTREEGHISQEGDAFSPANMNGLEQRVANGFVKVGKDIETINSDLSGFHPILDPTGKITGYKTKVGADTVFPFNSGILGKTAFIVCYQNGGPSYLRLFKVDDDKITRTTTDVASPLFGQSSEWNKGITIVPRTSGKYNYHCLVDWSYYIRKDSDGAFTTANYGGATVIFVVAV